MNELLARTWWAIALRGALALLFGRAALALSGITVRGLVLAFGAYTVADGILAIVAAIRAAREHERWWPFVIEGLLGIGTGGDRLLGPGCHVRGLRRPECSLDHSVWGGHAGRLGQ